MADVDAWDAVRDARTYPGPGPVVAHPPCGPWGRLRHLYRGTEHDCAPRAVEQVRKFGGVLEHPAGSKLWEHCGLLPPIHELPSLAGKAALGSLSDTAFGGCHGAYTIELDQVEWGHVARKRTWLYLVGVPREALEAPPFPGAQPTHWLSGFRSTTAKTPRRYKQNGCAVPPGIKVCSAQQRRRTPPELAAYLVRLARAAGEARRAA